MFWETFCLHGLGPFMGMVSAIQSNAKRSPLSCYDSSMEDFHHFPKVKYNEGTPTGRGLLIPPVCSRGMTLKAVPGSLCPSSWTETLNAVFFLLIYVYIVAFFI